MQSSKRVNSLKLILPALAVIIGLNSVQIFAAQSGTSSLPFGALTRYNDGYPVLWPSGTGFDSKNVLNPGVIVKDGKFYMFYRALTQDFGTSSIGLATSSDGVNFTRNPQPVIYPTEPYEKGLTWSGCEDPTVVKIDNTYYLTYVGYDGYSAQMCLATSPDLVNWTKKGPMLPPSWSSKVDRVWSKGGSILTEKIDGKYWMYFGDYNIWVASSTDLVNWAVDTVPVLTPPKGTGSFDSGYFEWGPPPILIDDGILFIYNANRFDPLPNIARLYTTGWALFDRNDPTKLLAKADTPILEPETQWEKDGTIYHQWVPNVVFTKSAFKYNSIWYFYYGAGDSYVCLATAENLLTALTEGTTDSITLFQNYPNPFHLPDQTTITYSLQTDKKVTIKIYTVAGELVRTLVDETKTAGTYSASWDGKNGKGKTVASGVYLCEMAAGSDTKIKKIAVIK